MAKSHRLWPARAAPSLQPVWDEVKTAPHWKKIGLFPHHGINLPLFSLRTKQSCGIGEFSDLIPLIDYCKTIKLDCIQLLPLNDTGTDPSPYNPLSSCALDPVYLSLADLPDPAESLSPFLPLNQSPRLLRNQVKEQKLQWLKRYFDRVFPSLSQTEEYRHFLSHNPWLEPYALFVTLKDQFDHKSWTDWPAPYQAPHPDHFETHRSSIDFHSFLQFHCFSQLAKVHAHATQQGLFLQGDIPILISPDSVDVWAHRSLFHLDIRAGAPPDAYNPQGQFWGFPLFNWDAMRHDGFSWWRRRLKIAEQFFHLYRIDHVVGFFRLWGFPSNGPPSFFPPNPSQWVPQGKELLSLLLESSPLLPIAEDLGTIPPEVYPILKELGICGTKVIRWQRDSQGHYIPFSHYEPFSMTTLSTPDMLPLEAWWEKEPSASVPFAQFMNWPYHPILTTAQRLEILRAAHHTPSYFHINLLQEYLALFPELIGSNPENERVNVPGTLLPTNWTYRFRPYLEEIIAHQGLREAFTKILD